MCGLAGGFFKHATPEFDLRLLAHRGPDSSGQWRSPSGHVWLGHTRLAIIDRSPSGFQPMEDTPTGNCIVFNGEIYNNASLRAELETRGVVFKGGSDTETLLHGYTVWGEGLLSRLRGMFAFVIYDSRRDALWLARDRFGIKPLYTTISESGDFLFASEIRWLTANLPFQDPTKETIAAYLQSGVSPHRTLLYPQIAEFPVASSQWVLRSGPESTRQYWSLAAHGNQLHRGVGPSSSSDPRKISFSEAARNVRKLLEESVSEHLVSDVPVSCLLSGGMDSSIITALASRSLSTKVNTFSVGFDEAEFDESQYARRVSEQYGTCHHHIQLSEDQILENVHEAVSAMDLPTVDGINTFIVVRQVAQAGYKVVLSGLGGDELFGGYPQFRQLPRLQHLAHTPRFITEFLIRCGKARHLLRDIPRVADTALFDLWWRRIWGGYLLESCGLPTPELRLWEPPDNLDDFGRISWSEITHYMRDTLLRDGDQMSMACSLEMRVPFLDHRLVEYVMTLPGELKQTPNDIKPLLAESCRDLLPPEIFLRKKMGFELPMDKWMRGPLQKFVTEGLASVEAHGYLNQSAIKSITGQFANHLFHWSRLWAVCVLGHWLINRPLSGDSVGPKFLLANNES